MPFDVIPAWQRDIVNSLQTGDLDVALLVGLPVSRSEMALAVAIDPTVETLFPDDLHRLVLRRERAELLIPRESPLAERRSVPRKALAGARVAMLGPNHGQAIIEPIRHLLEGADAHPVVPPEPHAIGVERYGRQFRMPAISLGWFQTTHGEEDMVRRPIEDFDFTTELALVHAPGTLRGDGAIFWSHAAALFEGSATPRA